MVINQEYDIFIAYHGTAGEEGSRLQAEAIYDYLTENGIKCFLFSKDSDSTIYKANFLRILQSKLLLLVCSDNISRTDSGELNYKTNYHLYVELDTFFAMAQSDSTTKSFNDAKVFFLSKDSSGIVRPSPETLHPLFNNRDSFFISDYYDNEDKLDELLDWVQDRLDIIDAEESTNELICVMNSREGVLTKKIDGIDFKKVIRRAKLIKCTGISNWTFSLTDGCSTLIKGLKKGTKFEMLFLDPDSQWTEVRAKEENKNTRIQITDSLDMIRSEMEKHYQGNAQIYASLDMYTYDQIPRDNIILVYTENDAFAFVQSYSRTRPGSAGMVVVLRKRKDGESPLFESIEGIYDSIKKDKNTKKLSLNDELYDGDK